MAMQWVASGIPHPSYFVHRHTDTHTHTHTHTQREKERERENCVIVFNSLEIKPSFLYFYCPPLETLLIWQGLSSRIAM